MAQHTADLAAQVPTGYSPGSPPARTPSVAAAVAGVLHYALSAGRSPLTVRT